MFWASLIGALVISSAIGGLIRPTDTPIILSRSNAGETSHYVFDFSNESRITSDAKAVFTFPPEFPVRLFETECSAYIYQAAVRTQVPCTTEPRKIILNLETLGVGEQIIGFHDVINPSSAGGTGYFWIETYQDATLIDSNRAYPEVGITNPPKDAATVLQSIGASVTSYSSTITLSTGSSLTFAAGSWIRVSLPEHFTFSAGPRCLLGVTVVNCKLNQYDNLMVETEGLASMNGLLKFTLQNAINPPMTGSTGTFLFEVLEKSSTNVIYSSSDIGGFTITPGYVTGIQMQRSLPHLNTPSYYYIRFRTTSNIPSGGSVVVILPEQYQDVTECQVTSGLEPRESVKCSYSGNQATYSDFSSFKAGVIELKIKAVNPSSSGTTGQITISTYNKDGVLIDQNLQSGTFVFSDIDRLKNLNLDMFKVKTDSAIGKYGPIEFMLETRTPLPPTTGSTRGRIVLTLPDDAQVHPDITKLQCLFGRERVTSPACTISGQVITIQTPSTEDFESCPISVTITTLGDPTVSTQGIMLTQLGTGMQRLTIETFIWNGSTYDPKEKADYYFVAPPRITSSTSDLATITPGSLSFVLSHYSNGGHVNSLDFTYTNSLDIEVGGRLRIELHTEDNSFLRDLGLDLQSFETIDYVCIEKDALNLVSSCTLTAGTLTSPVMVDVFFNAAVPPVPAVPAGSTLEITLPNLYSTNERDIAPSITVKNLDSDGFVVEYDTYTSEKMIRKNTLSCSAGGTVTANAPNIVQENTEFVFNIPNLHDLAAGDIIFIKFPEGYIWDASTTIGVCSSGFTTGMNTASDFEHYSKDQTHIIKFTSSVPVARESGSFNLCMSFPNRLYSGHSTFRVLVIQTLPGIIPEHYLQVTNCLDITTVAVPNPYTITPTIDYKLPDSSVDVMGTYELLHITITGAKIVQAGSIWIQLPKTHYTIVGTKCNYIKQAPAGTVCTVNTSDANYGAYILTKFGTSVASTVFDIYMSVNLVNSPTGTGDIIITSLYDDETVTTKLVEKVTQTRNFTSYKKGLATAEQVTLLTPYIEGRAGEFGPLVIKFTPTSNINARTGSNQNVIVITLPGATGTFLKPAGSYLHCTIGGQPASFCSFDTVSSVDKITLKQPSEMDLVSGTEYEIVINYIDSTDSSQIGLKWPAQPGTYRFKIEFGATLSNAVAYPTLILRPKRITGASVKSYSMSVNKPNILDFEFTITTELKKTDRATETQPGSLYIWFPSSDWGDDLGLGVPDMTQIDCPVSSVACLAGLECYLIKEYNGYTKIKITNSLDCPADTVYNIRIPGIINPTTSMTDIVLYISTELEDLTTATTPFLTWLDFIELNYIDTTFTHTVTATTNTIPLPGGAFTPNEPDGTTDIDLIFTPTVALEEGSWIFITIPSHTSLSTLACSINAAAVSDCKYFDKLNYLYLSLGASYSLTAGTQATITFVDLALSSYEKPLSFVAYHFKDRQLVEQITHNLNDGFFITGDITIVQLETMGSTLIAGDRNILNVEFSMEDDLVAGGYIYWEVFVGQTSATTVDTSYCQVTIQSLSAGDFNCEIVTGTPSYLKISGFSATLTAGTVVKVSLGVIFPPQNTYSTTIKTHNGLGFVDAVTQASAFVVTTGNLGNPLSKFVAPNTVFYRRAYPVRPSAQVGDLNIKDLTFPSALVKDSGQVKISFDKSISQVTDSIMRCIWTISGEDYISPSCTITSTAATTTYYIMVKAPIELDVPVNTAVNLLITSHIDGDIAGFRFDVSGQVYTVTITADDGVVGGTAFDMLWVTQLEVLPQPIEAIVTPLHTVPDKFNILDITLYFNTAGCTVPDGALGGRIVIEFPNTFDNALGLGIEDAGLVPCSEINTAANTSTALKCYLSKGDSVNKVKPKIHVSGFTDYDITGSKLVRIEKIKNPTTSGDDKIVDLTIYAENIDTKVPGTKLCQSTLYNVMTINTSASTVNNYDGITRSTGGSGLAATGVGYSAEIEIPTGGYAVGDILAIYLDTAATASSLTLTAGVGDLTYHTTSHMAYIKITTAQAAQFSITLTGFTSPSYQTELSFYYLGVQSSAIIAHGTIGSETYINAAVVSTGTSVFKENREEVYAGEVASFIVYFRNTILIPAEGNIEILVDTQLVAQDQMVSFYYLSDNVESFKNRYTAANVPISSVNYDTYKIYSFSSSIAVNTDNYFKLTLKTPTTAGSYKIYIRTNAFADTDSLIETFENTVTVTNKDANPYFSWPGAYLYPVDMRAGGTGPFMMKIYIPAAMSGAGNVVITLPNFQGLATDHILSCLWDDIAADTCAYDGTAKTYTVGLVNGALTSGEHTLVLTSKIYKEPNVSGILYPASAGTYLAKATITIGANTYSMAREYFVLPSGKFKSLKITSLNTYQNSETVLKIEFIHPTGLTTWPNLMVCLPTVDENGTRIFDDDLGYGLADGSRVPCAINSGINTDTVLCTLKRGYGYSYQPACILADFGVAADDSTNPVTLILFGLRNPATTGKLDILHVSAKLWSYSGSGINVGQTYPYIYTVQSDALTTNTGTYTLSTLGTDLKIVLTLTTACGADDVIVIQGTNDFLYEDVNCAPGLCTYKENDIRTIFLTGLTAADCTTLSSTGLEITVTQVNVYSLPGDLKVYWAQKDPLTSLYSLNLITYTKSGTLANIADADITITPDSNILGLRSWYTIGFKPSVSIPSYGCIKIDFSSSAIKPIGNSCYSTDDSEFSTKHGYTCKIESDVLKLTDMDPNDNTAPKIGYNGSTATNPITLRALFKNPTSGSTVTYTLGIYYDNACTATKLLQSSSGTETLTLGTDVSTDLAYIPYQESIAPAAAINAGIDLTFTFTPPEAMTAYTDKLYIVLGNLVATDLVPSCEIITDMFTRKPAICSYDSTNFKITFIPSINLAVNTKYTMKIYPKEGTLKTHASQTSTAMKIHVDIGSNKYAYVDNIQTNGDNLVSCIVTSYTTSPQIENVFKIEYETSSAITAASDVLFVDFPTVNEYGETLFSDDLGTGYQSGALLPCQAISETITCTLSKGDATKGQPARVIIQLSADVAADTLVEIYLVKIINPVASTAVAPKIVSLVVGHMTTFNNIKSLRYVYNVFEVSTDTPTKKLRSTNTAHTGQFTGIATDTLQIALDTTSLGSDNVQTLIIQFNTGFFTLTSFAASATWTIDAKLDSLNIIIVTQTTPAASGTVTPLTYTGLTAGTLPYYIIDTIWSISDKGQLFSKAQHKYDNLPTYTAATAYGGANCNDMVVFTVTTTDYLNIEEDFRVMIYPLLTGFTDLDPTSLSFEGLDPNDSYPEWYYDSTKKRFVMDINNMPINFKIKYWARSSSSSNAGTIKFEIADKDALNTPIYSIASITVTFGDVLTICTTASSKLEYASLAIDKFAGQSDAVFTFKFQSHVDAGTLSKVIIDISDLYATDPDAVTACTVTKTGLPAPEDCTATAGTGITGSVVSIVIPIDVQTADQLVTLEFTLTGNSNVLESESFNRHVTITYQGDWINGYRTEFLDVYRMPIYANTVCTSTLAALGTSFSSSYGPGLFLDYDNILSDVEYIRIALSPTSFNVDLGTGLADGAYLASFTSNSDALKCYIRTGTLDDYVDRPSYIDCYDLAASKGIYFPTIKTKSSTASFSYQIIQFGEDSLPACYHNSASISSLSSSSTCSTGTLTLTTGSCDVIADAAFSLGASNELNYVYITGFLQTPVGLVAGTDDSLYQNSIFPGQVFIVGGVDADGIDDGSFDDLLNGNPNLGFTLTGQGYGTSSGTPSCTTYSQAASYTTCTTTMTITLSKYDNSGSDYYSRSRNILSLLLDIDNFNVSGEYTIVIEFPKAIVDGIGCEFCHFKNISPVAGNDIAITTDSDANNYLLKLSKLGNRPADPTFYGIYVDWKDVAASTAGTVTGKLYRGSTIDAAYLVSTTSTISITMQTYSDGTNDRKLLKPSELSFRYSHFQQPNMIYSGSTDKANLSFYINFPTAVTAKTDTITLRFDTTTTLVTTLDTELRVSITSLSDYTLTLLASEIEYDSTNKLITITAPQFDLTTGLYYVQISKNDGSGFNYPTNGYIKTIEFYDGSTTYKDFSYQPLYSDTVSYPFMQEATDPCLVYSASNEISQRNYINVEYPSAGLNEANSPAVVIEFPTVDVLGNPMFQSNLGVPSVVVHEGSTYEDFRVEIESYQGSTTIEKLKYPTKMYIFSYTTSTALPAFTMKMMLFNVLNPTASNVVDLITYTQNYKSTSVPLFSNRKIVKGAIPIINKTLTSTPEARSFPTGTNAAKINSSPDSTDTITLSIAASALPVTIKNNDRLLLEFPTEFYDITSLEAKAPNTVMVDAKNGYAIVTSTSTDLSSIEVHGFNYMKYKPLADSVYFIKAYLFQSGQYVKTITFSDTPPTTWTYSALTVGTLFGLNTARLDNLMYLESDSMFKFDFQSSVSMPSGSSIVVIFPSDFTLYECNASSDGFSTPRTATCAVGTVAQGINKWIITGFGTLTAGQVVSITGFAKTASTATTSAYQYTVETYLTTDVSGAGKKMGELLDCKAASQDSASQADCQVYNTSLGKSIRTNFKIDWQYDIDKRMYDSAVTTSRVPIVFTLQPKYSLTTTTHYVQITTPIGYSDPTSCTKYCMFKDLTTKISYACSSYGYVSSPAAWKIYAPRNTEISNTKKYEILLFTHGCEYDDTTDSYNGFSPIGTTASPTNMVITAVGATTGYSAIGYTYVEPINELTVLPVLYDQDGVNFFKIKLKETQVIAAGTMIVIEMIALNNNNVNQFDDAFGTGYDNYVDVDCDTDLADAVVGTSVTCRLIHSFKDNTREYDVGQILVRNYANVAADTEKYIWIPLISNPDNDEVWVDVSVKVYSLDTTVNSEKAYLAMQATQRHLFKPEEVLANYITSVTHSSIPDLLTSTDNIVDQTSRSFSITLTDTQVYSSTDDFIIWKMPHSIINTGIQVEASAPSALFPTIGYMITPGITTSNQFDFTNWSNPVYAIAGNTAKSWHTADNRIKYEYSYNQNTVSYTPLEFAEITTGVKVKVTTLSGGIYSGYYDQFYVEVKLTVALTGGYYTVTLPNTFSDLSADCLIGNNIRDVVGIDNTKASCTYSSRVYTISNLDTVRANTEVKVIFWGKITATTASDIVVTYYKGPDSSYRKYESKYSITPTAQAVAGGKIVSPAQRSSYSPLRLNNQGQLYFQAQFDTEITANTGYVKIQFETSLMTTINPTNSQFRCTWSNPTTTYSAKSCSFATDALTIHAPLSTPIAISVVWTITVSSVFNAADDEGLKVDNASSPGYHTAVMTTYPDGLTATEESTAYFFIPPAGKFTQFDITPTSTTKNAITNLKFDFKSSAAIEAGLEAASGTTELVIEFSKDWDTNIADFVVSTYPLKTLEGNSATYKLYIQETNDYAPTQIIVRGFSAIALNTAFTFTIYGLKHPNVAKIPLFKAYTRKWTNAVYSYGIYTEVRYPYKIATYTPNAAIDQTIAYTAQKFDTTTAATLNVKTAADLATGDILFFRYTSSSPSIGSITLTSPSHTMTILQKYNMIMIKLTAAATTINSGSGIDFVFGSMPNPSYPISATWELHVISGGKVTDKNTYTAVTYTAGTSTTATINYRDYYLSSHTPGAGLTYEMVVKVTPGNSIDKIPKGGSVVINLVNFVNSPTECIVEHGLWPYECTVTGPQIKITGFENYVIGETRLPPIVVSFLYTVHATDATRTPAVNVEIFADASVSGSKIEGTNGNTNASFIFGAAETYLVNTSIKPVIQYRTEAGLDIASEIILRLKTTSTTSDSTHYLKITPPTGYSIPTDGVLECWLSNGNNNVPSECSNDSVNGFIKVNIPTQLPLTTADALSLILRVRDTAALTTDGIVLPSGTEVLAYPDPYSDLPFYIELYNSANTLLEAEKILLDSYGQSLDVFTVKPAHYNLNAPNLFDIEFKSSSIISAGGYLEIEFPTHDGTNDIWDVSMGLGYTAQDKINCYLLVGSTYDPNAVCTLIPASSISASNPVIVKVTGYAQIAADTNCKLSLIKLYNPINRAYEFESSVNLKISVKMRAYNIDSPAGTLIAKGVDYDVFKGNLNNNTPQALSIASVTSTTLTVCTEFSTGNGLVITFTHGDEAINDGNDYLIIELEDTFTIPNPANSAITCTGFGTTCTAISYPIANWIVVTSDGGNTNGSITLVSGVLAGNHFKSPDYPKTSYSVKAIVIAQNVWAETFTGSLDERDPAIPTVDIASLNNIVTLNTYALYTITITRATTTDLVDKIVVEFPSEYQWVDSECDDITGLKSLSRLNPISCKSDCNNEDCTNTITVLNFYDENPSTDIVITIGAMTPSSTTVSDTFSVTLHGSIGDNSFILEQKLAISEPTTYTQVSYPLDVWLDWVAEDIYDRAVRAGQIGEIHVRFQPTYFQNGIARLHLPEGFDIALGGRPYCEIAQGDMPFDNYPTYSDRSYRHIPATSCTFSNRVITITLPNETLREYYGLDPNKCTYFILTTTGASVNGFRAPWNPGYYDVKLQFFSDSNNIVEYSSGEIYIPGIDPPQLDINYDNSVTGSDSLKTIYSFNLITDRVIPKGYEYTYLGSIQPISTIEIEFDTFESFDVDLGNGYQSGSDVPCHVVKGLVAKAGESILCKFTAGDTSVFRPTPSKISITNFESIASGVQVEIHIPRITNPTTNDYKPRLGLGIYQIDSDQRVTWIYQMKYHTLNKVDNLATPAEITDIDATVTSYTVGIMNTLTLPFDTDGESLSADDSIVIVFPKEWGAIQTGFTARIHQSTNIVDSPTVLTYTNNGVIKLTLSSALAISTSYSIVLSNLRNPSYEIDCSDCGILYYSISSLKFKHIYTTKDISQSPISITAAGLRRSSVSFSSYSGEDVNVTILVTMEPEIIIKSGSEMTFNLATSIPNIYERPNRSCSVSPRYLKCAIVDRGVKITGFTGNAIEVTTLTIYGSKNPGTSSILPSSNGIRVEVKDTTSYRTLYYEFTDRISILTAKSPTALSYSIVPEFLSGGITCNYNIRFSSSTVIYPNSSIIITLPSGFIIPADIKCIISGPLSSFESCTSNSNSVTVVLNKQVSANTSVYLTLIRIRSPTVSTESAEFSPFSISIVNDGTTIGASSSGDSNSKLILYKSPGEITLSDNTFYPTNRGEYATYDIQLRVPVTLPKATTSIIVDFPDQFTDNLTPYDMSLICTSNPAFSRCAVIGNRRVKLSGSSMDITSNTSITISLFGIANPSSVSTGNQLIFIYNETTSKVIAYNGNAGAFGTSSGAKQMTLNSVDFSSLNINTKLDVSFNFSIGDYDLNSNDKAIWVDWPAQFASAFTEDSYNCDITLGSSAAPATCTWLAHSGNFRTEVKGISNLPKGASNAVLKFYNLPPPSSSGKIHNFSIRTFDDNLNVVLERSFTNLASNIGATFAPVGFSISTPKLLTVRKGFYSDEFSVTLSSPSFDGVTVTPVSDVLTFIPENLTFRYAWNTSQTMRVIAPTSMKNGRYIVTWETSDSLYSPPLDLVVVVVDSTASLIISVDTIPSIPQGTTTPLIAIKLERAPIDALSVDFSFLDKTQEGFFKFNPSPIVFESGEAVKNFNITALEGASTTSVRVIYSGASSDKFKPQKNSIEIEVLPLSISPIYIRNAIVQKISPSSATIKFFTTGTGILYYVYALKGVPEPTYNQILSKNIIRNDVQAFYGEEYTQSNSKQAQVTLSNLEYNTEYVLYATPMSLSNIFSQDVEAITFKTTLPKTKTHFKIYTTSIVPKIVVIDAVAATLALPSSYFKLTGIDPELYNGGRRLQSASEYVYELTLEIPDSLGLDPPVKLLRSLDLNLSTLKSYLPELDTTKSIGDTIAIASFEFPTFRRNPSLVNIYDESVVISASLNLDGLIGAVALPQGSPQPTSRQIMNGMDSTNTEVPSGNSATVEAKDLTASQLTLNDLTKGETYDIWLSAKNSGTLVGELMDDDLVHRITAVPGSVEIPKEPDEWF